MKTLRESWRCGLLTLTLFVSSPTWAKHAISKSTFVTAALPLIGGAYSYTLRDYEGMKGLAYSCAFTTHITTLTKNTVRRERPNGENELSFPSGHAAASFTGASYLHHRYGWKWGVPMYLIAAAISVQRVNVDAHYWTDVLAGAALGYLSGSLFVTKYNGLVITPTLQPQQRTYGVQLKVNWR